MSLLLDLDARTLGIWINGIDQGIAYTGIPAGAWGPAGMVQNWKFGSGCVLITDPAHFAYTPPAGYGPWMRGGATVVKGPPSVQAVVTSLCERAGLDPSHFDASALASITRPVRCMAVSQIVNMRSVIELLESAYFFEMTVSDKIYFRPRGGASVATIPYLDLGATKGTDSPEPLALLQANELEIPAQVALTYINIDNDYQPDTQYSDRLISAADGTLNALSMALGMSADEAKAIADTILLDTATSVLSSTIQVLGDYCRLEPTDVVTLTGQDGAMFRARLVKKTDSYPLLTFDAVLDDASALIETGITSADYASSTVVVPVAGTLMALMDVPILQDSDNDAGFYVATKGDSALYPGSAVFNSVDDVTYVRKATVMESAVFGVCTTTLGDWTRGRMFDEMNTVTVDVGAGSLASDTRDNVLHDLAINAMLVGSEMIQFRTATITAPGVYVLSGLLRGGRGTEWAMTGHVASERCVLLRAAGLRRVPMLNTDLGLSRYYKGVTLGEPLSSAAAVSFTDNAIGLKPFSPILFKAGRDAANNIVFEWQRRTRLAVRMIGPLGINVPLGEDTESYEIDIFSRQQLFDRGAHHRLLDADGFVHRGAANRGRPDAGQHHLRQSLPTLCHRRQGLPAAAGRIGHRNVKTPNHQRLGLARGADQREFRRGGAELPVRAQSADDGGPHLGLLRRDLSADLRQHRRRHADAPRQLDQLHRVRRRGRPVPQHQRVHGGLVGLSAIASLAALYRGHRWPAWSPRTPITAPPSASTPWRVQRGRPGRRGRLAQQGRRAQPVQPARPGQREPTGASGTGTGNVTGPSSAVDAAIALFDGTTGTIIKDSGVPLSALAGSNNVGYLNAPQNSQSANYTTVLADSGKHLLHPSADTTARIFTIDANATVPYPIGTAISFVNQDGGGVITIAINADTMRLAGPGTTGSRTLAANGIATALKVAATEWLISGTGLT